MLMTGVELILVAGLYSFFISSVIIVLRNEEQNRL